MLETVCRSARFTRGSAATSTLPGRCEDLAPTQWPPFALLLTSPPYESFRSGDAYESFQPSDHEDNPATYLADAHRLFSGFARLLSPGATVAVVVSQLRHGSRTRPLVWELGATLNETFMLREDIVRVNTGGTQAGPGYDHDHILIFDVPFVAPVPAGPARVLSGSGQ